LIGLKLTSDIYIECIDFSQLVELLATFHFSYSG
jgi:hypothetical protein